jgi:hypothetical protein
MGKPALLTMFDSGAEWRAEMAGLVLELEN